MEAVKTRNVQYIQTKYECAKLQIVIRCQRIKLCKRKTLSAVVSCFGHMILDTGKNILTTMDGQLYFHNLPRQHMNGDNYGPLSCRFASVDSWKWICCPLSQKFFQTMVFAKHGAYATCSFVCTFLFTVYTPAQKFVTSTWRTCEKGYCRNGVLSANTQARAQELVTPILIPKSTTKVTLYLCVESAK